MAFKEQIALLNQQPWFKSFIESELLPSTPEVPSFNPAQDNTERWKYDSAMREGYILCLKKIGAVKNG